VLPLTLTTQQETREVLDEVFRTHIKLKHSEDFGHLVIERNRERLANNPRAGLIVPSDK